MFIALDISLPTDVSHAWERSGKLDSALAHRNILPFSHDKTRFCLGFHLPEMFSAKRTSLIEYLIFSLPVVDTVKTRNL